MHVTIQQNQKHFDVIFPNVSDQSYSSPITRISHDESESGESSLRTTGMRKRQGEGGRIT